MSQPEPMLRVDDLQVSVGNHLVAVREAASGEARRRRGGVLRRAAGRRDLSPIGVPLVPVDPEAAVPTDEEEPRRVVAA